MKRAAVPMVGAAAPSPPAQRGGVNAVGAQVGTPSNLDRSWKGRGADRPDPAFSE